MKLISKNKKQQIKDSIKRKDLSLFGKNPKHSESKSAMIMRTVNITSIEQLNYQLIWEVKEGNFETVKEFLELGADADVFDQHETSILTIASGNGSTHIVKLLLNFHANPDVQDADGSTALIEASTEGHLEIVKLLIDSDADATIKDNFGKTALIRAQEGGHKEISNILRVYELKR